MGKRRTRDNEAIRHARTIDRALECGDSAHDICAMLQSAPIGPKRILGQMVCAGRLFSSFFRASCTGSECEFVCDLAEALPAAARHNYERMVRNLRIVEVRRRGLSTRGRINIPLGEPFEDDPCREVNAAFARAHTLDEAVRAIGAMDSFTPRDLAGCVWTGRIYQADFFRAAPPKLKMRMLEFLHYAAPAFAQPFVTQLLRDRRISRRYRALAWTEGVMRPHTDMPGRNASVAEAYAAAPEKHLSSASSPGAASETWLRQYTGGDRIARFDIERILHGVGVSRWLLERVIDKSLTKVFAEYYFGKEGASARAAFPLEAFLAYVCVHGRAASSISLLRTAEARFPGCVAAFRDAQGATLLEYALHRCRNIDPRWGGWAERCLGEGSRIRGLVEELKRLGCDVRVENSAGICWEDVEDIVQDTEEQDGV